MGFNTQPPEGGWAITFEAFRFDKAFQHTAARRRLVHAGNITTRAYLFQHTAARRRLGICLYVIDDLRFVSTHSRPKAAGKHNRLLVFDFFVSTHSRPKAAGYPVRRKAIQSYSFNTQPPEGGWLDSFISQIETNKFQHTAARRRLAEDKPKKDDKPKVSTHSRPKAAGWPPLP